MAQNKNNKTEPLHNSLGIIDRVIRTLRDMAYTAKIPKITPDVMDDLVYQYNNAKDVRNGMFTNYGSK